MLFNVKGGTIQIDEDDYERVSSCSGWYISNTGYVRNTRTSLSKFIVNSEDNSQVKFRNGDRLDYRKENLIKNWASQSNSWDFCSLTITKGNEEFVVHFDFEDTSLLKQYKWAISENGYVRTKIRGKNVAMHRYVLSYSGSGTVDHIDQNKLNNQKVNLRVVSQGVNNHNTKNSSRNTSGIRGVRKVNNYWMAQFQLNGRRITKYFSISLYGDEAAKEMAIEYRNKLESEYL